MTQKSALIFAILIFLCSGILAIFKDPLVKIFLPIKPPVYELGGPKSVEEISRQTGEWDPHFLQPIFLNAPASYPLAVAGEEKILGAVVAAEEKWVEIDLSEQKLYAHEGDRVVYTFPISSGKWAPTPTGEFRIWIKLRYSLMHGGNPADGTYYYLPNVPYVMYFYNGYGLHGTYWHNNFGTPMSHGCVNLSIPDAEKLYWWTNPVVPAGKSIAHPTKDDPGTRIVIHE